MSGLKTFPQAPYHDDYSADKDYLRILFRPGYAVQTREVNQLQTILQSQIGRMGDHFFENGARIIRGEASINTKFDFVKVGAGLARVASAYVGATITSSSGVKASIKYGVAASGSDVDTLYIQYTSGSGTSVNKFTTTESVLVTHLDGTIETIIPTGIGAGSIVSLDSGVYYLSNEFVHIPASYYILSKYETITTGDYSLGFVLDHAVVTPDGDSTLYDNATGTDNFAAPGAHRYKINITFGLKPTGSDIANYVEIVRVVDGTIATKVRVDDYTVFQDVLAQRTFDESGDYVSNEFLLDVREHLKTSTNRGQYSATDGGDESKLVYALDPGKAYVRGYPIETSYNTYLVTDKSRTTKSHNNVVLSFPYNSSLRVTTTSAFEFGVGLVLNGAAGQVGTATVRDIRFVASDGMDSDFGIIDIDIVNIAMNPGFGLGDITSVTQGSSSGTVSTYSYDATESSMIFKVPFGYVSTLSSVALSYRRTFDVSSSGTTVILTAPDTFSTNPADYVCQYTHATGTVVVAPIAVSAAFSGSASLTLPHSPTSIVKVTAGLTKASATYRSKTIQTQVDSIDSTGDLILTNTDGIAITSIMLGSIDVTSSYSLDSGQRDTVYDYARLVTKVGAPTSGTLTVTYTYFNHSSGDFFAKNSYSVDYSAIPSYTTTAGEKIFLGSVLDFRRSVTAGGVDYVSGFASSFAKNSTAICDYSVYLSRYDRIIVDRFGSFFVKSGTPSESPVPPVDSANSMTLYTILVNPYTFDNTDVVVTQEKNRRYTMRDIGLINDRLETVEYYASLNLLEKQVIDKSFINKFNTGFLVDNFTTQNIADATSPELHVGFDLTNREIRPQTPSKFVPLGTTTSSGVTTIQNVALLNYTEVQYITQPLASEIQRIQPYIRYQWDGNLVLVPSVDSWVSTNYLPDIIVDGGVLNVTQNAISPSSGLGSWVDFSRGDLLVNSSVSSTIDKTETSDSFVGTSPIPFIRSRTITLTGNSMKPNTKLNFFFDDIDVHLYVRPIGGTLGSDIITSGVGSFSAEFVIPESDTVRFRIGNRTLVVTDASSSTIGTTHASAVYSAGGLYNNYQKTFLQTRIETTTKTAVGVAAMVAVGRGATGSSWNPYSPSGIIKNPDVGSVYTSDFYSGGVGSVYTSDFYSGGVGSVYTSDFYSGVAGRSGESSWGFSWSSRDGDSSSNSCGSDPLAESFSIDSDVGAFITSIDLFFGPDAISNTSPVIVYLRTVENGYPTATTIAKTSLPASNINASNNGSVATKFTFSHPVFLEGNKEYAFVVKTDSETLTLWTSTLGAKSYQSTDTTDATGQYITKQSYLGSLFRSQNDRTWTAEQSSDIKFTLYRADFITRGSVVLSNIVPSWDVGSPYKEALHNPLSFVSSSNTVTVKQNNHGFGSSDSVTLTGMTSGTIAGIPFGELFGTPKLVTRIDTDSYTIQTTTAATSTITTGGEITATAAVLFGEAMLSANDVIPSGTSLRYGISTKVKGGTQQASVNTINKSVTKFNSVRYTNASGDGFLNVSAVLSTSNSYVSPAIDLYGTGMVCIGNRVNGTASPSVATYVQKPITLKNAASEFITYMDVNRPAGATVAVYYRVAQDNVATSPWVLAAASGSQGYTTSDSEFLEYKFVPSVATGDFFVIQIKIEMKTDNMAAVPRCKALRTITLKS